METSRRSGIKIMASLITILGSFAYILILAVINGSFGYLLAMGVTIFGSIGLGLFIQTGSIPLWIIFVTIGCGVLRGGVRYIEQYSNHYIAFKLLAVLRDKIFAHLRVLAPAKLDDKKKGSLVSLITSDIETLEVFYAHTISPICIALITCVLIIVFVGLYSSIYFSLIALCAYIIIGIIMPLITSKALKNSGVRYREEFALFNAYYLDSIKGVKEIVINNAIDRRKEKVNQKSDELLAETKKIKHLSSIASSICELVVFVIICISLSIGIILFVNNIITLDKMLVALVAIFSSFGPVIALSALPSNLTQTFASGERVLSLLEEKPQVEEITNQNNFDFDSLKVRNVKFGYNDKVILNDVSLDLKLGEIVGIQGESGCGKSTLLKLLLRFYKKNDGSILYNDIDIESINTLSLLDNVTMVSQSTYLFDDTILNNLKIAKKDATKEEIIEACKKASIHDFILTLPEGYDTLVGGARDNISAGETQRIGLARAFLKGSKVILLDEPTSNVDAINEGIILKALISQKKEHAIIIVSHRESTLAIADHIYYMNEGKLTTK